MSTIWLAAEKGDLVNLNKHLDAGVDVNARSAKDSNATPLIMAVLGGSVDAVKLLLAKGADVNLQDDEGDTALGMAGFSGLNEACGLLLDAGANPDLKNNEGQTPADQASFNMHEQTASFITQFAERSKAPAPSGDVDEGLLEQTSKFVDVSDTAGPAEEEEEEKEEEQAAAASDGKQEAPAEGDQEKKKKYDRYLTLNKERHDVVTPLTEDQPDFAQKLSSSSRMMAVIKEAHPDKLIMQVAGAGTNGYGAIVNLLIGANAASMIQACLEWFDDHFDFFSKATAKHRHVCLDAKLLEGCTSALLQQPENETIIYLALTVMTSVCSTTYNDPGKISKDKISTHVRLCMKWGLGEAFGNVVRYLSIQKHPKRGLSMQKLELGFGLAVLSLTQGVDGPHVEELKKAILEAGGCNQGLYTQFHPSAGHMTAGFTPKDAPGGSATIKVVSVEGFDLVAKDRNGLSDPYYMFFDVLKKKKGVKTPVQKKTLSPKWDLSAKPLVVADVTNNLHIQIWDKDFGSGDDWMGGYSIPICMLKYVAQASGKKEITCHLLRPEGAYKSGLLKKKYKIGRVSGYSVIKLIIE